MYHAYKYFLFQVLVDALIDLSFDKDFGMPIKNAQDLKHSLYLTLGGITEALHRHGEVEQAERVTEMFHERLGLHGKIKK